MYILSYNDLIFWRIIASEMAIQLRIGLWRFLYFVDRPANNYRGPILSR